MIDVCFIGFIFTNYILSLVKNLKNIANWEAWPFKLIYAPLIPVWCWYMLRSRAIWFFTPSNPRLTFGGLDGEPKKEMYDLLPAHLYPATFNALPNENFLSIVEKIHTKGMIYPIVVKPEVGCAGMLFRKIDNEEELKGYHEKVPVEYIVQQMVMYPMEVSVFYIRHPEQAHGSVTGFLHKIPMNVEGNDFNTLEQLILMHPKAVGRKGELFSKHKQHWHKVIPAGEKYMLSHAANHNRGAHFIDLKDHIDDKLVHVFDDISHYINDFFYGRYDILCNSIEDLKNGENFSILEYNGCGAEPNHIYDTGYSLGNAYREILKHWQALFEISQCNKKKGVKPWPFMKGLQFRISTKKHYKVLRQADKMIN